MGAAGQIGLAFDVDDPGPTHGGGGRDPGGLAEHVVAQGVDGQPVDLTHHLAVHVDHQGPAVDHFLKMLFDQVDR